VRVEVPSAFRTRAENSPAGLVKVPPLLPKLPVNQRLRPAAPRSRITPFAAGVIRSRPRRVQPAPKGLEAALRTVAAPLAVAVVVTPERTSPIAREYYPGMKVAH
jgi:hypothetical protein